MADVTIPILGTYAATTAFVIGLVIFLVGLWLRKRGRKVVG